MAVKENPKLSFIKNYALSDTAAVISKTAAAPIERVILLMQYQDTNTRRYTGAVDCAVQIFRNEGLLSFWRYNVRTRYFFNQALNFTFNEKVKGMFKQNKNDPYLVNFTKNVSSGGVAGGLSLCCFYSLDSARIRFANDLRSFKKGDSQRKYKSLFDVYRKTLATKGIVGLHRGFVISCIGVIIYRGCYFGFYDTLKPILLGPDASIALSFLLGYSVTVTANFMSHSVGMIRLRMMM